MSDTTTPTPLIKRLPDSLPIFPLHGVLLLPKGQLPLNIFEPRYINMIDDALAGDRLIGMVQPVESDDKLGGTSPQDPRAGLFAIGCAGRITQFAEEGNRYRITLTGLARFHLGEELTTTRGYRRIVPDWAPFLSDLRDEGDAPIDRQRLLADVKAYFQLHGLSTDWQAVEQAPDDRLVTSIAMGCPFAPAEKQALLEAPDLSMRASVLMGLMEMAVLDGSTEGEIVRH